MSTDISRAADFSVRVTDINYASSALRLNAGRNAGLTEGDEFQILVSDQPLPSTENGLSANYYTAVARVVEDDSTICELRHATRKVKKSSESFDSQPAREMVRRLPDPAIGLISARAWVNFPEIPVITDADVERSLQMAQEREREAEKQSLQAHDTNEGSTTKQADPLGDLLDGILKRRKKN